MFTQQQQQLTDTLEAAYRMVDNMYLRHLPEYNLHNACLSLIDQKDRLIRLAGEWELMSNIGFKQFQCLTQLVEMQLICEFGAIDSQQNKGLAATCAWLVVEILLLQDKFDAA